MKIFHNFFPKDGAHNTIEIIIIDWFHKVIKITQSGHHINFIKNMNNIKVSDLCLTTMLTKNTISEEACEEW